MRGKIFPVVAFVFLFGFGVGDTWGQGIYKWVDEKGTIHFSDNPAPITQKSQETIPDKNQLESPDKNQGKGANGQAVQKDSHAILKQYEFGRRNVPDQMLKQGSARPTSSQQGAGKTGSAAAPKGKP